MPFNLSVGEIVVLLVVAVILFGGRLPEVARTVAMTVGSIKRGMSAEMGKLDREMRAAVDIKPAPLTQPAGPVPGQECEEAPYEGGDPDLPQAETADEPEESGDAEKSGNATEPSGPATPPENPPSPTRT